MKKIIRLLFLFLLLLGLNGCSFQSDKAVNTSSVNIKETKNEVPALVRVSAPGSDAAEPVIATDNEGNIYVAYVEHTDKAADVYLQKFASIKDAGIKTVGERVRINPVPGQVKAWRGDQPTVQTRGEKVFIGWNERTDTTKDAGNDLMLSVSEDGGKTFAAPVKINDDSGTASHGMHAMSVSGDHVYFAWLDERYLKNNADAKKQWAYSAGKHEHLEPNAELYFAISKDGGKTFSANKKVTGDVCPCCKASLLISPDGGFYLSWRHVQPGDMRHIAAAFSGDGGETFGAPVIVSDDKWHINACPVSGASLAIGEDKALKAVWYTAGSAGAEGLYWAECAGQNTFSPRKLLSEGMVWGTPVMLSDEKGGYRIFWTRNKKILSLTISAGGEAPAPVREIGDGDLPAAVVFKGVFYIAYIKNEEGKRNVWLQKLPD